MPVVSVVHGDADQNDFRLPRWNAITAVLTRLFHPLMGDRNGALA